MAKAESSQCHQISQRYDGEDQNIMNWKILKQRTCLNLISAMIIVAGLGSSFLIYQMARNDTYGASDYEADNRGILSITPENSKLYRHNLEIYGGKFAIIMDDFRRWFVGLWYGKSLAFIIACTTVIISFILFYKANFVVPNSTSDGYKGINSD
jgi:hypothetical protein